MHSREDSRVEGLQAYRVWLGDLVFCNLDPGRPSFWGSVIHIHRVCPSKGRTSRVQEVESKHGLEI